jgi:hypothetical protein
MLQDTDPHELPLTLSREFTRPAPGRRWLRTPFTRLSARTPGTAGAGRFDRLDIRPDQTMAALRLGEIERLGRLRPVALHFRNIAG